MLDSYKGGNILYEYYGLSFKYHGFFLFGFYIAFNTLYRLYHNG